MKCLLFSDSSWCDSDEIRDLTDDPRDATCADCLNKAAAYGAAAAMRFAAVEAGATRDPELVRERDEAMRKLNTICKDLESRSAFFCTGCEKLKHIGARALQANDLSWCDACADRMRVP